MHSRGRRRAERAALDATLLEAAARADEGGVKAALARGADVNAANDATGNTAVTCAIAGDRCVFFRPYARWGMGMLNVCAYAPDSAAVGKTSTYPTRHSCMKAGSRC